MGHNTAFVVALYNRGRQCLLDTVQAGKKRQQQYNEWGRNEKIKRQNNNEQAIIGTECSCNCRSQFALQPFLAQPVFTSVIIVH